MYTIVSIVSIVTLKMLVFCVQYVQSLSSGIHIFTFFLSLHWAALNRKKRRFHDLQTYNYELN